MKYILTGSDAIKNYHQWNYDFVANAIINNEADIFEIESLDGIYELLEQLKGWDDFVVITTIERTKILQFIDK